MANFSTLSFPEASDGFSGRTVREDIDNDGFIDVLQADATLNGFGCDRHLIIWRNEANPPFVTFAEETGGIPLAFRKGTWDVALIDLNNDGWKDLIIGTCNGTSIWMAEPPASLDFLYPEGLPATIPPNQPYPLLVDIQVTGSATVIADEVKLHTSVNGDPFATTVMTPLGGNSYSGILPASNCLDHIDYYVSAAIVEGGSFLDPPDAPSSNYSTVSASGMETVFEDRIEGDTSSWTITSVALIAGEWEQAEPEGTVWNGSMAAPDSDAGPGTDTQAFVTENGLAGGAAGDSDLDGGPTRLVSPLIDLAGSDAYISYDRWFFTDLGVADSLQVAVSNDDGNIWIPVEIVTESASEWVHSTFLVSEHVRSHRPGSGTVQCGRQPQRLHQRGGGGQLPGGCTDVVEWSSIVVIVIRMGRLISGILCSS